ncbi:DUF1579 domain-containing protein [Sediminibacterium soli]|uniref:DUF1579 domain-containing protein n=1 Tax=Sediminibacterium soli TaxID=2698829 RepID=UPI001379AE50|nr:DUF1579 domain-containing protein [Sediminibacterium soli]NCI47370.1 DUF1579 domain-containing protein [Sediminibacterium soli]
MKHTILVFCMAAISMVACKEGTKTETGNKDSATAASKTEEAWVPIDSATQMAKMMEYATPGDMHKMMASWSGNWQGEMTVWNYEGAAPQMVKTAASNSMAMDGRYQVSRHTGNMMGMPFEGMSIMGYDNALKKFTSSWIDNMGTGIMNTTGDWDAASKTLTSTGSMPDVCRPGKTCSVREVYTVVDDNTHMLTMYGPDPKTGKQFKMMEIKLTRKK